MHYLTEEEILLIHYAIMGEHNDEDQSGIKYEEKFEAMLARPHTDYFGVELYPTFFEKACCYYHTIARTHIFQNGNKRTALTVFLVLLEINNFMLNVDDMFLEDYTVKIAHDEKYRGDEAVTKIVGELSPFLVEVN